MARSPGTPLRCPSAGLARRSHIARVIRPRIEGFGEWSGKRRVSAGDEAVCAQPHGSESVAFRSSQWVAGGGLPCAQLLTHVCGG